MTYMVLGVFFFQAIDPAFAKTSFHEMLFVTFMTCTTVGWGHIVPSLPSSMIYSVFYGLIGVPLTFALIANMGRMFSEFCMNSKKWKIWSYLSGKTDNDIKDNELSISMVSGFLIIHMFCSIPLFGLVFDDLQVIQSIYFNFISVSCIGFGDIHPDPRNLSHSLFMIVFFLFGIIFTGCLMAVLCFKFEKFAQIHVDGFFYRILSWISLKVKKTPENQTQKQIQSVA